jgi:hypothetical protein
MIARNPESRSATNRTCSWPPEAIKEVTVALRNEPMVGQD